MRTPVLILVLLAAVLAAAAGLYAILPPPALQLAPRSGPAIAAAKSWGYQLQNIETRLIPDEIDVLVIDHSRDGTSGRAFTPADVASLQRRSDGRPRIVLSYLSIGEAESYRAYWQRAWSKQPPAWLGAENPAWKGNYAVQYWLPAWQRLIFNSAIRSDALADRFWRLLAGAEKPYLDRILEAGFDGVYLDRVDAFEKLARERPEAKADMAAFVAGISAYAKSRRPGFLVVPQNGEALLADPRYVETIDGVGKEDLLYGESGDGNPNVPTDTRSEIALLNNAKAAGRPVFVIEYLAEEALQRKAAADLGQLGFIPLFAGRQLTLPPALPPRSATAPAP